MSAWCASTASARRRCLVPSGDTYVHVQFLRDASISPRGNTVQPCVAAPCHNRSSISSSVKDCGGLPRVAEDSVAEHAAAAAGAAAAGGGAAVVVVVRRDIFTSRPARSRRASVGGSPARGGRNLSDGFNRRAPTISVPRSSRPHTIDLLQRRTPRIYIAREKQQRSTRRDVTNDPNDATR